MATYIIILVLPLLALLSGGLSLLVIRLVHLLPSFYLWVLASVIGVVAFIYGGLGPWGILLGILACLLVGSLIGASVLILVSGKGGDLTSIQRWITICGLVSGAALAGAATWWLVWQGRQDRDITNAALETAGARQTVGSALTDPSQPDPFRVLQLTYGSGMDRHRREYGERAMIRARTVDAPG